MRSLALRIVPVVLLALAGCGGGGGGQEVVVDGSSTVYRISLAAQEGYKKEDSTSQVLVSSHGTGPGFSKYAQGEVDIVDASRAAKPKEEEAALKAGMPWTLFHVGYDGITVVVNPKNDFVKSLTAEQLKQLFEPDSKIHTWKDLDPSWPDRKITLFTPDRDSGTFDFFTEEIMKKAKAQRQDAQQSADDNVLVTGVTGDADALGYFGYAYYAANQEKLRAVPIQNGKEGKPILPSPETILDKTYSPLARRLYIYVKTSSLQRPEVLGFVKYYLKNVAELAKTGGYVAPTTDDVEANAQNLAKATSK